MSEETLHVNEFEKDTKPVYRSEKNLQQRYGPEANFSYRAHSAEEILSDKALLREMIMNHHEVQCPRLAALDDYIKARNPTIYNAERRRAEKEKADYRVAHNFAKIINVFDVGYNTGVPIKKVSEDDKINEMIKEYDRVNEI